jgi:hypothetical protein
MRKNYKILPWLLMMILLINHKDILAQKDDSYMRFEQGSYLGDWAVNYKGKMISGISKKNILIAKDCNCDEAVWLFELARKQYVNSLSLFAVTLPIGSFSGIGLSMYLWSRSIENESPSIGGLLGPMALGIGLGYSPVYLVKKSSISGNQAVREFNKCIDQKPKE